MSLVECRYEFDLIAILVVKFYTVGWIATLVAAGGEMLLLQVLHHVRHSIEWSL